MIPGRSQPGTGQPDGTDASCGFTSIGGHAGLLTTTIFVICGIRISDETLTNPCSTRRTLKVAAL